MTDPLRKKTFHIGGQTRDFLFNHVALRLIQKKFNGTPVMSVLRNMDWDVACEVGSAGLTGAGDGKATADRVGKWLDDEPLLFGPFTAFLTRGVTESYKRTLPVDSEEALEIEKKLQAVDAAGREYATKTPAPVVAASSGTDGPTQSA